MIRKVPAMVAFMHTGTRLTAGYRYTTLGDATVPTITSVLKTVTVEVKVPEFTELFFPSAM